MPIVQKNKTVYFGGRRWVEGDVLPPFLKFKEKDEEPEIKEILSGRKRKVKTETDETE